MVIFFIKEHSLDTILQPLYANSSRYGCCLTAFLFVFMYSILGVSVEPKNGSSAFYDYNNNNIKREDKIHAVLKGTFLPIYYYIYALREMIALLFTRKPLTPCKD